MLDIWNRVTEYWVFVMEQSVRYLELNTVLGIWNGVTVLDIWNGVTVLDIWNGVTVLDIWNGVTECWAFGMEQSVGYLDCITVSGMEKQRVELV